MRGIVLSEQSEEDDAPHSARGRVRKSGGLLQDSLRTFVSAYETKGPMSGQRL